MDAALYNSLNLLITALVGLTGIWGVIYTARQSRVAALSSTYLSEMISVYSEFVSAVSEFVYHRCELQYRDNLSDALLRLQLFAPKDLSIACQDVYAYALEWGQIPRDSALEVDQRLQTVQKMMIEDIEKVRKSGHH